MEWTSHFLERPCNPRGQGDFMMVKLPMNGKKDEKNCLEIWKMGKYVSAHSSLERKRMNNVFWLMVQFKVWKFQNWKGQISFKMTKPKHFVQKIKWFCWLPRLTKHLLSSCPCGHFSHQKFVNVLTPFYLPRKGFWKPTENLTFLKHANNTLYHFKRITEFVSLWSLENGCPSNISTNTNIGKSFLKQPITVVSPSLLFVNSSKRKKTTWWSVFVHSL